MKKRKRDADGRRGRAREEQIVSIFLSNKIMKSCTEREGGRGGLKSKLEVAKKFKTFPELVCTNEK